ncbi:glycosyltransferase [Hyphococcus lacteus]|uniref:Glycosyltransferase n=1 Tax=Hyphococcus lacteus TaxID=3143536 RepID=A0ABV3Z538_9PROT
MRILLFSTLFPNAVSPSHGVFVENRMNAYRQKYDADVKVVAPVPWFPFRHQAFGAYAVSASVPFREVRNGIDILHPRYLIPPKIAMHVAPSALTRCLDKAVRDLRAEGWEFDFIDAHYFYPDGVAASRIAARYDKPFVITGRGTDINLLPSYSGPRRAIIEAASRADSIITVASALKDELERIGVAKPKVTVLRNGVDLKKFRPAEREVERRALGLSGLVLASVGHLIDRKGHDLVIEALQDIKDATLLIAGEGPERGSLEEKAIRLGVFSRVNFLGRIEHDELYRIYNAADILVLASSREGWPNVLLESLACGTPCVATNVWGSGEVITAPAAGQLAKGRSAKEIAEATNNLRKSMPTRQETRAYAEQYSWEETADGMHNIFSDLLEKSKSRAALQITPIKLASRTEKPKLIVTVDTEEQFDWNEFDNTTYLVNETSGIERFQNICESTGATPLYFLTWPLLDNAEMTKYFRSLKNTGVADCGIHLHQWATPPGDFSSEYFSYQQNLPREALRQKLKTMAEKFEATFGERATSHRAGRYGIGREDYAYLSEIGITHDFSPSASFDFHSSGGPDFSLMTNMPFEITDQAWKINVTPVCGARAILKTRKFLQQNVHENGFVHSDGGRRATFTRAMRLSPEGASLADLKALANHLIDDQTPVLSYSLHSTSLVVGGNDYARDAAAVDEILLQTEVFLRWFKDSLGGEILSLQDLEKLYENGSPT